MKFVIFVLLAAAMIGLRVGLSRRRRAQGAAAPKGGLLGLIAAGTTHRRRRGAARWMIGESFGDVGIIAMREIRERVRGRIFKVGTLVVLVAVGAAIIIPTLHSGGGRTVQTVGVVGGISPPAEQAVHAAASRSGDIVRLEHEPSLGAAEAGLRAGNLDLVVVDGERVVLSQPATANSSPADPTLVQAVATYLGVVKAYQAAGLTPAQQAQVSGAKAVPIKTLEPGSKGTIKATSVIGLVLVFVMLTQYNTWILMGVMQEKSSRVVEVLLATVRPLQLLGGKVLGIGLVALGQATVIVAFALVVGAAVGSDLLRGTAPLVLGSELLWLVLGYAFYCWVYAAAGSTAERQDQVQTLALPLSIPILVGYIFAITVASSGHTNPFFDFLAYLPPTAPFCMPVLVALGQAAWWEFIASVLITLVCTAAMAVFAARIYRRAVLRTGSRVRLREVFAGRGP